MRVVGREKGIERSIIASIINCAFQFRHPVFVCKLPIRLFRNSITWRREYGANKERMNARANRHGDAMQTRQAAGCVRANEFVGWSITASFDAL